MFLTVPMDGQRYQPSNPSRNMGGSMGSGMSMGSNRSKNQKDSVGGGHKEIPKNVKVWTVHKRFGDIIKQPLDTVTHMYQNALYTSGLYGDYNFLGNLGTPRISRIFINRSTDDGDFLFTEPYSYFYEKPEQFLFTNTYSPYANLSYNTCGNRTNGEDHFTAKYGVNVNKRLGFGFKVNYLYGRGYYSDQSTSHFNINLYGSYIGDQYQAHLLLTTNKQKVTENGGITDDMFITHPESFSDNYSSNEIPTMLSRNWNRNSNYHVFLTHRYNIGFHRQVPMTEEEIAAKKFAMASKEDNKYNDDKKKKRKHNEDEDENEDEYEQREKEQTFAGRPDNAKIAGDDKARNDSTQIAQGLTLDMAQADSIMNAEKAVQKDTTWMKTEYVPVTSFIHTAQLDSHNRIYQAYQSPQDYYGETFFNPDVPSDSIYDETKYFRLRNTVAMSMLEGFNKWMVAGIKVFAASDLRHYVLPDEERQMVSDNLHNLTVGGQMSRYQGKTFHYNILAETCLLGDELGQVKVDGNIDINFPLFGDTVTLAAKGFFHNERPNYYMRHYHGKHFWWDNDLSMQTHTRIEGLLSYQKTRTSLRFAADALTNYTYFGTTFDNEENHPYINNKVAVHQAESAISVLTASLDQKFRLGIVNWESVVTWQKSTNQDLLPVPTLNIYTNLFLRFRIAKVLYTELGVDARYFTEYEAPNYVPGIGQFAVQENPDKVKIGNYPILNAYANFNLKGTRFFIVYSHANQGMGNRNQFLTPHYPINNTVLRFGLSWNFFN